VTRVPRQVTAAAAADPFTAEPADDFDDYESLEVWPDEIKLGDVYGGYVVTGIHQADHYRDPAVRLTIFTDPSLLPEGVDPQEFGRFVLMTDRRRGHKVPIERRRR
jgi:hypothetical protein